VDRILLTSLEAEVIVIIAAPGRHRQVHFLHAALDFGQQLVRQRLDVRGHRFRAGVFRVQLRDDFRVFLLVQPAVVVGDDFAVARFLPHRLGREMASATETRTAWLVLPGICIPQDIVVLTS
jgi:hypothetical protein